MRRVVGVLLAVSACAPAVAVRAVEAPAPAPAPAPVPPEAVALPEAPHTPMPALLLPRLPKEAVPKPEGHLPHPVCVGPINVKKDRPHTAACCYPAKEVLVKPIRAAFPALRACYDNRKNKVAEGRVVFVFRVEQDGSVPRVCSGDATAVEDEDAVRCMVEAMRKVRFPSMSDAERDLCGLFSFNYPVMFEP